jgi:hypothetical protein
MAFSRNKYDDCAYDLQLKRSTEAGSYQLFNGAYENCKTCISSNGFRNNKDEISTARAQQTEGFASTVELESKLTNRITADGRCNDKGRNAEYLKTQIYDKEECSDFVVPEDTRFTHPLSSYRGLSLTDYYLQPYLPGNPQCHVHEWRNGINTRSIARDNFTPVKPDVKDQESILPPGRDSEDENNGEVHFVCNYKK